MRIMWLEIMVTFIAYTQIVKKSSIIYINQYFNRRNSYLHKTQNVDKSPPSHWEESKRVVSYTFF